MTTYLGKSYSFCLPRVPFVNCRQFMYLVISLLVLRAGYGIWLYQFLIIAYRFTLLSVYTSWNYHIKYLARAGFCKTLCTNQCLLSVFTFDFGKLPVPLHLGKDKYFFHYIWENIHLNWKMFGLGMPPVTGGKTGQIKSLLLDYVI